MDRTRAHPNLLRDPTGSLWVIDHGSCLFLRLDDKDYRALLWQRVRPNVTEGI